MTPEALKRRSKKLKKALDSAGVRLPLGWCHEAMAVAIGFGSYCAFLKTGNDTVATWDSDAAADRLLTIDAKDAERTDEELPPLDRAMLIEAIAACAPAIHGDGG